MGLWCRNDKEKHECRQRKKSNIILIMIWQRHDVKSINIL